MAPHISFEVNLIDVSLGVPWVLLKSLALTRILRHREKWCSSYRGKHR